MAEGIKYYVQAILEAKQGKGSRRLTSWAKSVEKASYQMARAGTSMVSSTLRSAAAMGKVAASMTALAGAGAMGAVVKSALDFNNYMEQTQYAMASTLQLMGHSSGDFARNLKVSEAAMNKIFYMAAKSPATYEQATTMFRNMLPGARSVTDNMEEILALTKDSLALGMIMGGDFRTTGAQMSRIMTGGAGAEFETWKVLQTPIRKVAMEMGLFNKELTYGEKTTAAWNALKPEDRFKVLKEAVSSLEVATEAFGHTWTGLMSTIMSNWQMLKKTLGEEVFIDIKAKVMGWVTEGGLLDPKGSVMQSLNNFVSYLGFILAKAGRRIADAFAHGVEWLNKYWVDVVFALAEFGDKFIRGLKTVMKIYAAKFAVGGGMAVAGAAAGVGASVISWGTQLVGLAATTGISATVMAGAAAALLPIVLAVGGAATIAAGVVAYFVSRWEEVVEGFRTGQITLEPLIQRVNDFWVKLVAVGEAFLGTESTAGNAMFFIDLLAGAMQGMMDIISAGLGVFAGFKWAYNLLKVAIYGGIELFSKFATAVNEAMMWLVGKVADLLDKLGADETAASLRTSGRYGAREKIALQDKLFNEAAEKDRKEAQKAMEGSFAEYDAWNKAKASQEKNNKILDKVNKSMYEWMQTRKPGQEINFAELLGKAMGISPEDMKKRGARGGAPRKGDIRVDKMIVNQDLRNQDPDRVIGAFYRGVEKSVRNRTQSLALENEGI